MNKSTLRSTLRQSRKALSAPQQQLAAENLCALLGSHRLFNQAQHIAFYFANDGEISPAPLFQLAHQKGKHGYFPVIVDKLMEFRRYRPGAPRVKNHFGIDEPGPDSEPIASRQLDLVLLPLVGFDRKGNRLGMGGGFYDRCLAFKKNQPSCRPVLVGLAHSLQEVDNLHAANWDIALNAIATEREFITAL